MSLVLDTLRRWLGVIAVTLLLVPALPGALSADGLSTVFDRLLTNPDDPALNIRYAELVEARGDTRKALAAYERALARDPCQSRSGLQLEFRYCQHTRGHGNI